MASYSLPSNAPGAPISNSDLGRFPSSSQTSTFTDADLYNIDGFQFDWLDQYFTEWKGKGGLDIDFLSLSGGPLECEANAPLLNLSTAFEKQVAADPPSEASSLEYTKPDFFSTLLDDISTEMQTLANESVKKPLSDVFSDKNSFGPLIPPIPECILTTAEGLSHTLLDRDTGSSTPDFSFPGSPCSSMTTSRSVSPSDSSNFSSSPTLSQAPSAFEAFLSGNLLVSTNVRAGSSMRQDLSNEPFGFVPMEPPIPTFASLAGFHNKGPKRVKKIQTKARNEALRASRFPAYLPPDDFASFLGLTQDELKRMMKGKNSIECMLCKRKQKIGDSGSARTFWRHLKTHREFKTERYICNGHPQINGTRSGGCGRHFSRRDALLRHVAQSRGKCDADMIPIPVPQEEIAHHRWELLDSLTNAQSFDTTRMSERDENWCNFTKEENSCDTDDGEYLPHRRFGSRRF